MLDGAVMMAGLSIMEGRMLQGNAFVEVLQIHCFMDKFENADPNIEIDVYKDEIMEHARDLWNNWPGDLSRHYVKPARNIQHAIKNCPKEIPKSDWEWLVKEHFYSNDFRAASKRNSNNRSKKKKSSSQWKQTIQRDHLGQC
ncbi:unnamed protein product, partial [Urochloa humidicola]